jgi:hypothetical protein
VSLRWERFAGDTSEFAMRLSLSDDPHPMRGVDTDTSASWGAIQIWVGGVNVCAHTDQGESMTSAHWYLLPILEWLVERWDALLHEERLPLGRFVTAAEFAGMPNTDVDVDGYWEREELRYEWQQRHSLRTAAEGGLFPDLKIRRLRDQIEFSWTRSPSAGELDVEWQAPIGHRYTDPVATAEVLGEVLSQAVVRLMNLRPESRRIHDLANAAAALRSEGRADLRMAWLAGLGTTAKTALARWRDLRVRVAEVADPRAVAASFQPLDGGGLVLRGSCQAALLFGSASPSLTDDDAYSLALKLLSAYQPDADYALDQFVRDEPIDESVPPWASGYGLAEDLLQDKPSLFGEDWIDVEGFLRETNVAVEDITISDDGLRAVSFASTTHQPTLLVNSAWNGNRHSGARRFTVAHELCHLLHDRTYGAQLAVASGPWAPLALEQRANAFAAMLLMPPDLLRGIDSSTPFNEATRETLTPIAAQLGVPLASLIDHAFNVGLIDEAARERLRWDASD